MAEAVPAAPAAAGGPEGQEEAKGPGIMGMLIQFGIIYFLMQRFMGGSTPAKEEGPLAPEPGAAPAVMSTPTPAPLGSGPATLMGIKMGLEYPPALEEFHTLRRMEIAHVSALPVQTGKSQFPHHAAPLTTPGATWHHAGQRLGPWRALLHARLPV